MKEEIDWKKYNKKDREFLIKVTLANRDYSMNVAAVLYSILISISALIISLYSISISIIGISKKTLIIGGILILIILVMWLTSLRITNRISRSFVKNLNSQYQNIHRTLHPELFKGGYHY